MSNPLKTQWQQKWLAMEVTHPKVQEMADVVSGIGARWFKNDPTSGPTTAVLCGVSGSGKTHAVKRLYRWCQMAAREAQGRGYYMARIPGVFYADWGSIVSGFKEGCYEVMDDLFGCEMLILDDLGTEHDPSRNALDKLCQILTRREGLWTVATTNTKVAAWERRWDMRVADRLTRRAVIVDLDGVPSYSAWSKQHGGAH